MEESFGPTLQLSLTAEKQLFMLMRIFSELSTSIYPALALFQFG